MSLIQRMCKLRCVYWEPLAGDSDLDGQLVFAPPVELRCRWEGRSNRLQEMFGDEKRFKEFVYVLQDVKPGGFLWLGKLEDLPPAKINDPRAADDSAKRIEGFTKIGKVRARADTTGDNRRYLRVAAL